MSNVDPKDEGVPVQPSQFGKRFGRTISIVLILIAVLVAIITFSGDGSRPDSQPVKSTNPF